MTAWCAKGRKQYRYHPRFRELRDSTKYEHVVAFAEALPTIRSKAREHMARRGLPREEVLATVVHLLETTLIRVGNDDQGPTNGGPTEPRDELPAPHSRSQSSGASAFRVGPAS